MWIEIFKTGTHTDSAGNTKEYQAEHLDGIASIYNEKAGNDESFAAPVVKGHPSDNEPALGWVERLSRRGKTLLAKLKELDSSFINEIKKGSFRKISMALYPDGLLRHVGFLGAAAPAVKGLKSVRFADGCDFSEYTIESEAEIENMEEKQVLIDEIAGLKKQIELKEFADFADSLINSSKGPKIKPLQRDAVIKLLEHSSESDKIMKSRNQFSEGNSALASMMDFLSSLPPIVPSGELRKGNHITPSFSNFSGRNVSEERLASHEKAIRLMSSNKNLSYEEAINIINKNEISQIF